MQEFVVLPLVLMPGGAAPGMLPWTHDDLLCSRRAAHAAHRAHGTVEPKMQSAYDYPDKL